MIINKFNRNYKNTIYRKIFNILIIISIIICFSIFNSFRYDNLDPKFIKIKKFENSYSKSFFNIFFFDTDMQETRKFREINGNNILNEHILYHKNDQPDVSVIITVHDQANCFYRALRSAQNQSLKNIEIIIVDDCSLDNTTEVIEKYMKEDNRIIYLKNESNNGKIKSRSDGVKLAKGEYLLVIDGDDGLATKDILYNCYSIAKIGNLDIVEFKKAYFLNRFYKKIENNLDPIDNLNNRIIYQPELKFKFVKITENKKKFSYLNRNVCSKLIRNEIFKQVLEFIGPKYTEDYMLVFEDTIMSVSLFILSNSYYLMRDPGYYRSKGECQESISKNVKKKCGYKGCTIILCKI
jgi:glycosyltransferase involved in cell wall biosynthesis